jgi:hypothetical protein
MSRPERVSFRVFIGVEIVCLILLGAGILTVFSPLWTPGGLMGWWQGYSPDQDVLGIVWLSGSVLTVMLGVVVSVVAAVVAISVGIASGIVGLATNRANGEQASDKADDVDAVGQKAKSTGL